MSSLDPYDYFSGPKVCENRVQINKYKNPFQLGKNELQEINSKVGFRTKTRKHHYLNLNDEYSNDIKEERAPFHKGEQNYNTVLRGLKKNSDSCNKHNALNSREKIIIRPNINIYICDPSCLNVNLSENENIQCIINSEIKKIREDYDHFADNGEKSENLKNSTVDMNAPEPIINSVSDLIKGMDKMNLNEQKRKERNSNLMAEKNNNEKKYTNDNNYTPGDFYMA